MNERDMNEKLPDGFKMTELGPLPEEWEVVKIGEVFNVQQGKQLSKKETKEGKIKKLFLRTSNLGWGYINTSIVDKMYFTPSEFEKLRLKKGDILICEGGDIGRTALYRGELEECAYQNHLHRLRPKKENIDPEFFVFWMNHAINQRKLYTYTANRTTIPNLSSSRLKNFLIPLPPLSEQKKIAAVLSAVQTAKEKTEAVIKAAKELKKSLMKHLFTYGPVSPQDAENVPLKETEIGLIPEEWEVVKLGDVFEFSRKPRNLKIKNDDIIPFIPMEVISKESQTVKSWRQKKYSEISSGSFVFKNDLIIAKITPSFENGKQAILDNLPKDFGYATTEIWALHPKDEQVITEYLYYYLKIPSIRINLAGKMEGSTGRQRLPQHVIENLKIPLPPLPVQQKIASILSAVDEKIKAEENKKKALEDLFKTLLHNLMTAKIRVNQLEVTS